MATKIAVRCANCNIRARYCNVKYEAKAHMTIEDLKQIEAIYIKFYQKVKLKYIWKQLRCLPYCQCLYCYAIVVIL